eukprot:3705488-Pyramimonas_sp.AAC.1
MVGRRFAERASGRPSVVARPTSPTRGPRRDIELAAESGGGAAEAMATSAAQAGQRRVGCYVGRRWRGR